jgi:hypothetical protein
MAQGLVSLSRPGRDIGINDIIIPNSAWDLRIRGLAPCGHGARPDTIPLKRKKRAT